MVDERCIVNAMVALLATGGSTNHLIHWVAVARAAGIVIDWNDFAELSDVVPLRRRVYPNGSADVNQFQAAGGPGFVIRELLDAGCMHADVLTVRAGGMAEYTRMPERSAERWPGLARARRRRAATTACCARRSGRSARRRPEAAQRQSGPRRDQGVVGARGPPGSIEAPARVFDSQEALLAAFTAGELERDLVGVVRWQGPQANGMPELHKLTPPLACCRARAFAWRWSPTGA